MNVLNAVIWIGNAWEAVNPETCAKCFRKCSFIWQDIDTCTDHDELDDELDTCDLGELQELLDGVAESGMDVAI